MRKTYLKIFCGLMAILLLANPLSAQQADFKEYKPLLLKNAARLGLTTSDVNDGVITSAYTDAATQVTYIYLQQSFQQIKVYNTIMSLSFRNGSLLYHSGKFVEGIAAKAGSSMPAKSFSDAVMAAAQHLQLPVTGQIATVADLFTTEKKYTVTPAGIAERNIDVTLYWTPSDDKQQVTLTWNVNIDELRNADWWNVRIDAMTGAFVQKDNWTIHEHVPDNNHTDIKTAPVKNQHFLQLPVIGKKALFKKEAFQPPIVLQAPPPNVNSATYRVTRYPLESPIHGSFTNELSPWLLAGAENAAVSHGWHFDGTNNYIITRGNNVFAHLDRRANNVAEPLRNFPDTSSTAVPTLNFIHDLNTTVQPWQNIESKKAATDNLFYWNNIIHDITYQYGFTEAAGNFQADNLSRGGAGNDFVVAHAQDSAGYNNANFSTPTEGTSGRMQMYTWASSPKLTVTNPAPVAGEYGGAESNFSTMNKLVNVGPVTGQVIYYNDDAAGTTHNACGAPGVPANIIAGKIVLIDRGVCTAGFVEKVKNAQTAGAIAVIVVNNVATAPITMGGTDNTILIPAMMISQAEGNALGAQVANNITATIASGVYIDGDFDNGIICHEYGHGISNRLTGGPYGTGCLGNAEQGGEGWSDYIGLMLTTDWSATALSDSTKLRPIGTYAQNQPVTGSGIRAFPYTTNMTANPLTYASVATNTAVHFIGTVWCSALWNMTWNIIGQTGTITPDLYNSAATGGNVIAMNLVMTGMKLQPCTPGFLDARNAILAADSILYNGAYKCAIWKAFARRGMGFSAVQGSSNSATDQVAAFDLPGRILLAKPSPLVTSANAPITVTHTATCECQGVNGFVMKDTIPAGFTYVSSTPAGTLSGNVLTFPTTSFASGELKNFSIVLNTPATGCTIDSVINDNRETNTTGGLTSSGSPAWNTSTVKSYSPASSWFAPNITTVSTTSLTSASAAAAAGKNLSVLSFWHSFRTETAFDGGVVEYSTDGTTWTDAAPLFVSNAYNYTMGTGTPLVGRRAFSGNSAGFNRSLINLSALGTTPVSLRFRLENDPGTGIEGWYVDDIIRANGCGDFLKTGVYNSSSVRLDTIMTPVFVKPAVVFPLTLLWFYANSLGGQVALDWKTVSEINVRDFTIEWSKNGTDWATIAAVNAANRSANNYNTIHATPVNGNNYYRIRMNDVDGKFTYSPVRIIKITDKANAMLVLVPNPVNSDATLYLSKDLKVRSVKVYDAAGGLVRQLTVGAGVQQLRINTANLAAGVYTVETVGGERQVVRMLVQH